MGTYVMSDIHGCRDEFLTMLDKIGFSGSDQLFLAGDYIDRGKKSLEMLKWIEACPANVHLVRGNHDEEFASNIDLMMDVDKQYGLKSNLDANEDGVAPYETFRYLLRAKELTVWFFDYYKTIKSLLEDWNVTLNDLCRWRDLIREMPFYFETPIGGRDCVIVHGGYAEDLEKIGLGDTSPEEFYLHARMEGYLLGGKRHGMVIAGHTPTTAEGEFTYNEGNVFRYYDEEKDCIFYDIDCGCVFRELNPKGKLACIRLEDEKIFYV